MAMVFVGVIILAVSAAMFWWAGPRQGSAETASVDLPAPAVNDQHFAPGDNGAVAGEATIGSVSARSQTGGEPPAPRPADAGADAVTTFQRVQPTETEIASVLATASETGANDSTVAVAETAEELLLLEAIQQREVEADLAEPSRETTAAVPRVSKVVATATAWVNLRTGPSDDAEVLMVVPALADIEAEAGCNWCAVTYDGRTGYIYKTFISYE